jgi:hypothetical protein
MESEDQYFDIVEVKETPDKDDANELLAKGWRLLKVVTKYDDHEYAEYVLGKPAKGKIDYSKLTEENAI